MTTTTAKLLKLREVLAHNKGVKTAFTTKNQDDSNRFRKTSATIETLSYCSAMIPLKITSL